MSDIIHFKCPSCQAGLKAKARAGGRIIDCPKCRNRVRVPELGEPRQENQVSPRGIPHGPALKNSRPKRVWLISAVGLFLTTLVVLAGYFVWWSKPKVLDCYVDKGSVVIDQEFRTRPDHVVLIVKVKAPTDEEAPEAKIVGADGAEWKYGALDRPGEKDGGDKSIVDFYFPIPRKAVEGSGLKFKYKEWSPLALPASIEFRESSRTGNLAPAIQPR